MKLSSFAPFVFAILAITTTPSASAFSIATVNTAALPSPCVLYSSISSPEIVESSISSDVRMAKAELIETAERLKEVNGVFLIDSTAKKELLDKVDALENVSEPPSAFSATPQMLGDWELVVTTSSSQDGIDTSKIPFYDNVLKPIRDSITKTANRYWKVQQRIKDTDDDGKIDRIDHVIEYRPPAELQEVLDNLPDPLQTLDINPLQVSRSQLVLIHKASVLTATTTNDYNRDDMMKIKLQLQSIVLNVAGKSTFLEESGKDLAGINIPQISDFLNAGTFETTYLDDDLRISRGKQGFVDVTRVFVRSGRLETDAALRQVRASGVATGQGVRADMDVDDMQADPDFETTNKNDTTASAEGANGEDSSTIESPSDVEDSDI
jgi:hypothetical protein